LVAFAGPALAPQRLTCCPDHAWGPFPTPQEKDLQTLQSSS